MKQSQDGETDLRIHLSKKLDRETRDHYKLVVMATDGGIPQLTGSIEVDVTVIDANDNNPEFENSSYHVTVPEDAPVGSSLIKVGLLPVWFWPAFFFQVNKKVSLKE